MKAKKKKRRKKQKVESHVSFMVTGLVWCLIGFAALLVFVGVHLIVYWLLGPYPGRTYHVPNWGRFGRGRY